MSEHVRNRLADVRQSRGVAASELARAVGISRQAIYAIEAGSYIPNTEVALRLARTLEVTVEELFSIHPDVARSPDAIQSEYLSPTPAVKGQPARVCQIGDRWLSVPVSASPYYLPEADGVITRTTTGRAALSVFGDDEAFHKRLILAGCDPATSLLSRMVEKISGVEIVSAAASSKLALSWLKEGKVHIAGSHLEDPATGEFNLPFLRAQYPEGDFTVVTFARWEEGLVLAKGNPKQIRDFADLTRKNVRLINREPGSGSRSLLDRRLAVAGVDVKKVNGYKTIAYGHLAAAYAVLSGEADCCLATRSAAQTFGLDFVPVHSERYDLVMNRKTLELPAAQAFIDVLQRAALRRKLELLAGYDTRETGSIIA